MADPTKFTPGYDYSAFQAANPTDPLPATNLDVDMANIANSIDETVEAVKNVRRSDGALQNAIVTPDSLAPATLALLASSGTVRGAWATATAYSVSDIVDYGAATYIGAVAHTSGSDFATDLAAGKWLLLSAPYQLAGLKWTQPCRMASTANLTLSGVQTIDAVVGVAGDRVLVKDQSSPAENGIYVMAAGTWARATDADAWGELVALVTTAEEGFVNADYSYVCTVDQGGTLDTTAVTWSTFKVTLPDGTVTTVKLVDGVLSADSTGRAKMADGFLTTAKLADGALSADATGLAKMANGYLTASKANAQFVNAATTVSAAVDDSLLLADASDSGNMKKAVLADLVRSGRRQTVLSGPVNSDGLASFGGSTGSTSVTMSGTLVVSAANGADALGPINRIGSGTNLQWTGLSTNGTMYLYVDVGADGSLAPGAGTLAPTYQAGGTYSTTNGQFTFNFGEMVGKVGSGSAAAQTYRVYVGKVTVSGSVVSAIAWFALNGLYVGPWTNTLPSTNATVSQAHNIGDANIRCEFEIECSTTDAAYAVGSRLKNPTSYSSTSGISAALQPYYSAYDVGIHTMSAQAVVLINLGTGNTTAATAASWKHRFVCARTWG